MAESESGLRLDKWLAADERLGSRSKSLAAIERGKVFLNGVEQASADASRRMQTGDRIRLWMDRPGSSQRRYSERCESGLHLLYEDSQLLVVNKPAGLLTVPLPSQPDEESLLDQVKHHLRSNRKAKPRVVHRIDRDTSGLVVFAKTSAAQHKLKDQFEKRTAERIYLALVYGCPKPETGVWRDHLVWNQDALKQQPADRKNPHAKEAVSRYTVIEKFKVTSLLEINLVTGKRNQIRIQAALRGHQLVGEKKYVCETAALNRIEFARQALHAHRIGFRHPATDRVVSFEAQIPEDLRLLLEKLRKRSMAANPRPKTGRSSGE